GQSTTWRITLPKLDAAKFDAALQSHQDALIAEWKRDHDDDRPSPNRPPLPGTGDAGDQPSASSCPRASSSHVCGARLRRHSWFARPPHPALGRRRPHRTGQPRPGVSVSPPTAPPRRHHHHRARAQPDRHRRRGTTPQRRIDRPSTDETPAGRAAVPGTYRRTRRLVVVRTLPTTTTAHQQLSATPHRCAPSRREPPTWRPPHSGINGHTDG
ncbi:MAG: hypothetical protein QOJ24_2906, partial [Mycobacterium sp.]|nr:hypothetical protein [Mycobacterium sp.]